MSHEVRDRLDTQGSIRSRKSRHKNSVLWFLTWLLTFSFFEDFANWLCCLLRSL